MIMKMMGIPRSSRMVYSSFFAFGVLLVTLLCVTTLSGCGAPKPSVEAINDGGEGVIEGSDAGVGDSATKEAPPKKDDDGKPYTGKPCTSNASCRDAAGRDYGYTCVGAKCTQQDVVCDVRTQAALEKNLTCMTIGKVCVALGTSGTGICKDPYCNGGVPGNFTVSKTRCRAPTSSVQKCTVGQILMGYFVCLKNGVTGNDPVECRDRNGGTSAFDCVSDNPFAP